MLDCPLAAAAAGRPLGSGLDFPGVVWPLAELLLSMEEDEAWLEKEGGGELLGIGLSTDWRGTEELPGGATAVAVVVAALVQLFLDWAAAKAALCFLR